MVERVGIVAKTRLDVGGPAPRGGRRRGWMPRGVEPVFEADAAALAPRAARRAGPPPATTCRDMVDLLLVLGGDGTLLGDGRPRQPGRARPPDPRRELRHLGFLTEINFPELYPLLESAVAGTRRASSAA